MLCLARRFYPSFHNLNVFGMPLHNCEKCGMRFRIVSDDIAETTANLTKFLYENKDKGFRPCSDCQEMIDNLYAKDRKRMDKGMVGFLESFIRDPQVQASFTDQQKATIREVLKELKEREKEQKGD